MSETMDNADDSLIKKTVLKLRKLWLGKKSSRGRQVVGVGRLGCKLSTGAVCSC